MKSPNNFLLACHWNVNLNTTKTLRNDISLWLFWLQVIEISQGRIQDFF